MLARQAAFAPGSEDSLGKSPTVTEVRFRGNTAFEDGTLLYNIRTRANRNLLGIPGITPWRLLYRMGEKSRSRGLARALKASGEPPAYLDETLLAADVERISLFYQQEGFRRASVAAQVDTIGAGRRLRVTFLIDQGPPTFIRILTYSGLDSLSDTEQRRLFSSSPLVAASPRAEEGFRPTSLRFSQSMLGVERRHLIVFLRDAGYAQVTRDSIRAFVTPVTPDSFDVRFDVMPGRRMRFGSIYYLISGPENAPARLDTLGTWSAEGADSLSASGVIMARTENERRLDYSALTRNTRFQPGEWFNESRLLDAKRRLEATGLFSFSDFVPLWTSVIRTESGSEYLPYQIHLRTRPRHQVRGEFFMLSRDAVLGDETGNEEVGIGLGTSYRNVNLLGAGEALQVRTSGSIAAALRGGGPFNTAQAELETSLVLPYLIRPFRFLDDALNLYESRTRLALRLLTARREELRLIIRGRGAFQAGIEMRHTPTLTSLVNLLDINLSDPDTLAGFERRFLRLVSDPVERERILEDYSRPQVNSALRYTLRSATANLLKRDAGYFREVSFELGGNVPYVLDRYIFSPEQLEGSIPGVPFFRREDAEESRLVYRQYVRLLGDVRQYRPVGPSTVAAFKLIAGWSHPVGRAPVVPFDRRFYSGGATSIRGWGLRELGPGSIGGTGSEVFIQGGDVKLEAAVEMRTVFMRKFVEADWMSALFLDGGNVWYGPRNPGDPEGRFDIDRFYKDLGLGSGIGLRIAWEYLILRLDVAWRLNDPAEGPFPDALRTPRYHFGIGQAF